MYLYVFYELFDDAFYELSEVIANSTNENEISLILAILIRVL